MMKQTFLLFLLSFTFQSVAQNSELDAFQNLAGSTWISEGKQLGGHDGKTVKEIKWGLNGQIVQVTTYTTDPQSLEFGLRNEGIRIFNSQSRMLEFYEFDKLGGVSKGIIKTNGKDIHYEYEYGDLVLRDSWIFESEDQYRYRVCSMQADSCTQVYHEGVFKRK